MNKIYTGVIAIVAAVTVVAGTAYAAFNAQVNINGVTLGTTTADLSVRLFGTPSFVSNLDLTGQMLDRFSPGDVSAPVPFEFDNTGDVNLSLNTQIVSSQDDWGSLSTSLQAIICRATPAQAANSSFVCPDPATVSTGWFTLADWYDHSIQISDLASRTVTPDENAIFVVNFRLPDTADNSVAGKTINNLSINVTGTQTP